MLTRLVPPNQKNGFHLIPIIISKITELNSWRKIYGIRNLLHRLKNKKTFDIEISKEYSVSGSSITDSYLYEAYPTLCGLAATESKWFKKFRSARPMIGALDHVSIELGHQYIFEIVKNGAWRKEFTNTINKIDSVGRPKTFKFDSYGTFSPTLLRYLKVYVDLKSIFGSLGTLRISEIGIGFGGQAGVINLLDKPLEYNLYDIPPVLNLAEKVISEVKIPGNFNYFDGRNPKETESDLIISNYAFSEINVQLQKLYLENVILKSPRGYMTWNSLSEDNFGGYSLREFSNFLPNSEILEECPKTDERNAILVWGRNLKLNS